MTITALAIARGRWQLDGQVVTWPCGCRRLTYPGGSGIGTNRAVATCKAHRRGVGLPLQSWVPS